MKVEPHNVSFLQYLKFKPTLNKQLSSVTLTIHTFFIVLIILPAS